MQKVRVIIIFLFIFFIAENIGCFAQKQSDTKSAESKENSKQSNATKIPYEVVGTICTEENVCYLIVYLDRKHFNGKDLLELIENATEGFKDKKGLTISFFDDLELAKSFASGKRDGINLSSDRRGWYIRAGNTEFLIFSPCSRKKKLTGDYPCKPTVINFKDLP